MTEDGGVYVARLMLCARVHAATAVVPTCHPRAFADVHSLMFSVELTTFSITWLTHTVYETKGVSLYKGCRVSLG